MQLGLYSDLKLAKLEALAECANNCDICRRMTGRTRVLSDKNGNVDSRVLFVAEAPGRLGADRTSVPLCGDVAGDNFERLLSTINWKREWVFITNAVLCNPRDESGNNAPPTALEVRNCSDFLRMTINLVSPQVIVTLGASALRALGNIHPHSYSLQSHVGQLLGWNNRRVFVAYHPGQRALLHRALANQISDFYKLSKAVHPLRGLLARGRSTVRDSSLPARLQGLYQAATLVTQWTGELAKFKLVKLLYLADLRSYELTGATITGATYLRQHDGPWLPDIDRTLKYMEGHEVDVSFRRSTPHLRTGPDPRVTPEFAPEKLRILVEVCLKHGKSSSAELKSAAYSTKPMKQILRHEREGANRLNSVILK